MLCCFLVSREKGGMEDRVNFPPRQKAEAEGSAGDNFFHFERTCSFHLEFLWSIHVEVGGFKPDFVSHFPRSKLGGYPLFHFLLGYLVSGLGIILDCR